MFHKNSSRPNGFAEICKVCKKDIDTKYRANQKDEISTNIKKEFSLENTLTVAQLAKRWGVTRKTLDNQRFRGEGPNYYKIGGTIRFDLDDVRKFENDRYVVVKNNKNHE